VRSCDGDKLARRPLSPRIGEALIDPGLVVIEVEQSARVVEQLAKRDRSTVWNNAGQPTVDRIIEMHSPLRNELQHNRSYERLRDARNAEAICRPQEIAAIAVGHSTRGTYHVGVPSQHAKRTRGAVGDEPLHDLLELSLIRRHRRGGFTVAVPARTRAQSTRCNAHQHCGTPPAPDATSHSC
jgi:hypothetical protein